jgi:hypothetical protein
MCFESLAWATKQELPAMQKIVLVMLADHENAETKLCFPSIETLSKECGMSERSVSNQIAKLAAVGLIEITRFNHTSNRYVLLKPDAPVALADAPAALADAPAALADAPAAYKPVIKPITKPINIITTTASKINGGDFIAEHKPALTIADLTIEQKECYDWAANHKTYWYTATTSIETFLDVLNKNTQQGLAFQYAEHKKARETWTVNGLNSEKSFTNKTGGNYETRNTFNQPSRLSKHDQQSQRFNDARERAMAEWRASNHIIDIN